MADRREGTSVNSPTLLCERGVDTKKSRMGRKLKFSVLTKRQRYASNLSKNKVVSEGTTIQTGLQTDTPTSPHRPSGYKGSKTKTPINRGSSLRFDKELPALTVDRRLVPNRRNSLLIARTATVKKACRPECHQQRHLYHTGVVHLPPPQHHPSGSLSTSNRFAWSRAH